MKPEIQRELQDELSTATDIRFAKLVELGLSSKEAERTLALFPDMRTAFIVANGYSDMEEGRYTCYLDYLTHIKSDVTARSQDLSAFQSLVNERTSLVPLESQLQQGYRDSPFRSSDYYEHLASQDRT